MAKHIGKKHFDQPKKDHHCEHFEEAFNDALRQVQGEVTGAPVTFEVDLSPNPGGVKEYRVIIGG
jgi:hypothetical protein